MSVLELKHVSYLYGKGTPFEKLALSDISVSFEEGKITGIIGHTGSGKSTLVELLNGILTPTEGHVYFHGIDINRKPKELLADEMARRRAEGKKDAKSRRAILAELEKEARSLRFRIGLVMQYPEYQLFDETVLSDMSYGPRNMGLDESVIDRSVRDAADMAGIGSEMFERSPFDLSGGEKRRVAIAGVLAMRPEVLILDEPAAGLDPAGKKQVFDAISQYNALTGATVILVSHSMEDLAMYCDRVLVMSRGSVHAYGTVEEVFSNPAEMRGLGLDVPQIAEIASRLTAAGISLHGDLYTVEGMRQAILSALGKEGSI